MKDTASHSYPSGDGWAWLYRIYSQLARAHPWVRQTVRAYFRPTAIESAHQGRFFRLLGVPWFGRIIPTGGITVRRLTGARMRPYTLEGTSLRAAGKFFYRACVFEALHLPFFLALLVLSIYRWASGRPDLAAQNMLVNVLVNLYPMLHHRYTRTRIDRLLRIRSSRSESAAEASRSSGRAPGG